MSRAPSSDLITLVKIVQQVTQKITKIIDPDNTNFPFGVDDSGKNIAKVCDEY